jgi:hypothetical protein
MRISIENKDRGYRGDLTENWMVTIDGINTAELGFCVTADDDEGMIRFHPWADPTGIGLRPVKVDASGQNFAIETRYGVVRINRAA